MGPEKPTAVLEKFATSDKVTIVIERQPDGKMRVTSGFLGWGEGHFAAIRCSRSAMSTAGRRFPRRPQDAIQTCGGERATSQSARNKIDGGIVRPSAFAVFRLTKRSNLSRCSTGRALADLPFRI
jgi:hypothetical protein